MKKIKSLYLDDLREPPENREWILVRSFEEAVDWMCKNGCPTHISLDHDLGMVMQGTKIVTTDYDAKSGYDLVKWIIKKDIELNGSFIPDDFTYHIHSSNPTGSKKMDTLLKEYLKNRQCNE